ncbi:MAG: LysR family transcriptional regulator [Pseudomonadota bacterium]
MLRELQTLLAVAQHGTFAAAGERIGLTQGAVSAQIQRLEEELGFPLFDRTGRSATLNAAGRETLARAQEIVSLCRQLSDPAQHKARGVIRMGAIASAQSSWLSQALAPFRREFPELSVRVVPGVSLNLLGQVDCGEIDMALMLRPPFALPRELRWHHLSTDPYYLVVNETVRGDDWEAILREQPFVRYDRTSFGGRAVERFLRTQRIQVNEAVELDELGGMVQAVASGLGVALMPVVPPHAPLPHGVRVVDLRNAVFYREVGLVARANAGSGPVQRLIEHVCATNRG